MNNIVPFNRDADFDARLDAIPPVAWAVAQLIVHNDIAPDVVADAVNFYNATLAVDDDD